MGRGYDSGKPLSKIPPFYVQMFASVYSGVKYPVFLDPYVSLCITSHVVAVCSINLLLKIAPVDSGIMGRDRPG